MNVNRSTLLLLVAFVLSSDQHSSARAGEPPPKVKSGDKDVTEVRIQTLTDDKGFRKVPVVANVTSVDQVGHPDELKLAKPVPKVEVEDVTSVPKKGVDDMTDKAKGDGGKSGKKELDAAETENLKATSGKKALEDDEDRGVPAPAPVKTLPDQPALPVHVAVQQPIRITPTTTATTTTTTTTKTSPRMKPGVIAQNRKGSGSSDSQHEDDLKDLKIKTGDKMASDKVPVKVAEKTMDAGNGDDEEGGMTSLVIGAIFGVILLTVLLFVGFKRLDAIRRRREYRKMNDFLIDGMYNDL